MVPNKSDGSKNHLRETHKMRYLFKLELESFMSDAGFKLICAEEWLSGKQIGKDSWSVCFIGVKE